MKKIKAYLASTTALVTMAHVSRPIVDAMARAALRSKHKATIIPENTYARSLAEADYADLEQRMHLHALADVPIQTTI